MSKKELKGAMSGPMKLRNRFADGFLREMDGNEDDELSLEEWKNGMWAKVA